MKPVRILVLILCACFESVAWSEPQACKISTPWAQFHRHNMQRYNPCERVLGVHNVGSLGLKWSYAIGNAVMNSSPAVASGVVYVGSDQPDNKVYALDAKTGAKLWSYATDHFVGSSPAVANGVLYIDSNDDKVYAFGLE